MGAFSGSLAYRQYRVRDTLPGDHLEAFAAGIERNLFYPLDPSKDQDRSIGWCNPLFALDTELDSSKYIFTDYLVLGLRVDAWSIPATTLKLTRKPKYDGSWKNKKTKSVTIRARGSQRACHHGA